jgi:hypothetical protein
VEKVTAITAKLINGGIFLPLARGWTSKTQDVVVMVHA